MWTFFILLILLGKRKILTRSHRNTCNKTEGPVCFFFFKEAQCAKLADLTVHLLCSMMSHQILFSQGVLRWQLSRSKINALAHIINLFIYYFLILIFFSSIFKNVTGFVIFHNLLNWFPSDFSRY